MDSKKAVLFDYDGVLVDTMEDMYNAWNHAFLSIAQTPIPKQTFFLLEGYVAYDMARKLSKLYNIPDRYIENIIQEKENYYLKHHHCSLNPKIKEILEFLNAKKICTGVVSGAPKERIKRMIGNSLYDTFQIVIGAGDYKKGKPDPQPYKNALFQLDLHPSKAIVIENAPLGILSAKAAGIFCIAVQSTLDKDYLQPADKIVENFNDLFFYLTSTIADELIRSI